MKMNKKIGIIENLPGIRLISEKELLSRKVQEINAAIGGNTGNIAYVEGLRSLINEDVITIDWSTDVEFVKDNCRLIIVCCANQLGEHTDLSFWSERIAIFGLPVVVASIGAQSDKVGDHITLQKGTIEFLNAVKEFRFDRDICNISTRGPYSSQILSKYAFQSTTICCPSLFINQKKFLGRAIASKTKLHGDIKCAISAGNPYLESAINAERVLANHSFEHHMPYIIQHPVQMLKLAHTYESSHKDPEAIIIDPEAIIIKQKLLPDRSMGDFELWIKKSWKFFVNCQSWLNCLENYDFVVGARFHGVMLALQAGIPACVVAVDARVKELAETTLIPIHDAAALDRNIVLEDMISSFNKQWAEEFDENRSNLHRRWIEFLSAHRILCKDRF